MAQFNFAQPVEYNDSAKQKFHSQGRARLRELAKTLALPKGTYEIRSNHGGIAVSGEVTLHHENVYVQILQSCLGEDMGVIVRTCNGRRDYAGGPNHWLRLSCLNDIDALAHYVRIIMERRI